MNWPGAFVLLLLVATTVSLIAQRLRVPYTVALVVAGVGLGAVHGFSVPPLTRDLMFGLVLPALVFEAAFDLETEEVRHDGVTLASLAVPGVIVSIIITALALSPALRAVGIPQAQIPISGAAVVFAALMSATDPVAVVALFRQLEAPRRLQVIVEGESLLNDGTAIIFFTLALANTSVGVSPSIVTEFLYIIGASVIVGGLIGAAAAAMIQRLYEPRLEVLLTTIAAYGSFVAAQAVGASGVIATVAAGLLCGSRTGRNGMSAAGRIATATFWDYVVFGFNSLVFLSIGLMEDLPSLLASWRLIVVAFLIVTITRMVVTTGIAGLLPQHLSLPRRWTAVLAWGGLRGALSMVLALSIPDAFPQRGLIITMTFGVVILSILIQGVSIGPMLRWMGLRFRRGEQAGYLGTQLALLSAHSALGDLERTGAVLGANPRMRRALAEEYDERLDRAERSLTWLGEQLGGNEESSHAARRLLAATERERIDEAFRSGSIDAAQRDRWLAEIRARWWEEGGGNG